MAFTACLGAVRPRRLIRLASCAGLLLFASTLVGQTLPPASALKQLSIEQLLDLEVTSVSRRPERLSQAASAIQVITAEDIRSSGATSLPEALRLASNLEVAQIDSRQWAISSRGFNNLFADKLLVLIDGRSVYTPLYAGVYWDVQNLMLSDVDRIEVISGPGATQWGANAVNGVINVTTKSAKDTQGGEIVEGAGTELRNSTQMRYGGRVGENFYYRVYAMYFDRGDSLRAEDRYSGDAWRMAQAGFRTDWDASADAQLTVQGDAYDGIMGQPGPEDTRANGANLLGRWSQTLADTSNLQLQAYCDRTHRRIPGSFTQDINTYDLDFQHRKPLGAHDLLWGMGYRVTDDSVVNTPQNAFLPPHVVHQQFNAFIQDEISLLNDRWHATLGSKVEHNDYTGFEVEPSGRLAWRPDRSQTVWAAISRAVRTPSRIDRDLFSPATPPYRIAGGPNVVSETLVAYELGYRVQLAPQVALSASAFHSDYGNLRSLEPQSPPAAFPIEETSGLNGRSDGIELTADWNVSPAWRLHAGYTELRVHSEAPAGSLIRATRDSIVRDAPHQAQLRSVFDVTSAVEFDVGLRYTAAIAQQDVPSYVEADARIGWQLTDVLELSVVGQNLLHAQHAEFNSPVTRRYIPRGVFAKLSWRF